MRLLKPVCPNIFTLYIYIYLIITIINSIDTVIITAYLSVGMKIAAMVYVLKSKDISGFDRVCTKIFVKQFQGRMFSTM